ncbi:DNA-deoxyinosine glycosylase [Marinobacterium sp. YM272]|uniref:DNA-deoxyinosine glycosylase n=1 Tax=Marinobacterium sp. YM272 TaxID=3421654 RepID=UPI003D7F7DBC
MSDALSFPPSWRADARVLILGSMPGVASLEAQRYYAHPRNAFWPILGELCGFSPQLPYEERLERLKEAGIALWDVIGRCYRPGSLDSSIAAESVQPNDLPGLLAQLPQLQLVVCNGGTAYRLFRRHFGSLLAAEHPNGPALLQLPSTSPAHAAMNFAAKREQWRVIQGYLSAQG